MNYEHDHDAPPGQNGAPSQAPPFWRSRYGLGWVFGAVAAFFLLSEHRAHFLGAPGLDILSHDNGHLWSTLLGEKGDPHFGVLYLASYLFLAGGFILLSSAWNVLYHAQREHALATTGPYAVIRHPQYVGFVLSLLGFLLQWPTLLTLVMLPVLLVMYGRLALTEEAEMRVQFGEAFERYAQRTPRFIPRMGKTEPTVDSVSKR